MTLRLTGVYRYPVKGMTPQRLDSVSLTEGRALPFDRAYALALKDTAFDESAPEWLAKANFLMLQRDEKLAALTARFDDANERLTIDGPDGRLVDGDLGKAAGRAVVEEAVGQFMGFAGADLPRLVGAPGHTISDHPAQVVSIIHEASVAALEGATGLAIDPLRFRGNFYVDGGAAWEEFAWIGRRIAVGGAQLEVTQRIPRCAATGVDPSTGERDMNLVKALTSHFGHYDMGVYARVVTSGAVTQGDELKLV